MNRLALAAALALGVAAHAGDRTEPRDVHGFSQVRLEGAAQIHIHRGAFAVKVSGPDEEVGNLATTVEDGTLVLRNKSESWHDRGVSVDIAMPKLEGYELDGAGDTRIEGFSGQKLRLAIRGAGNLRFSGSADSLSVDVRGTGDVTLEGGKAQALSIDLAGLGHVKASALEAKDARVHLGGTGSVEFTSNGGTVAIELSGMGSVRWRGSSKPVSIENSGLGHVEHEG